MDSDKPRFIDTGNTNNNNHLHLHHQNYRRDSESSPGFDDNTSNSTLSAASPDPAESSLYTLTSTTMTTLNGSQRIPTTTLTSNFSRVSVESWAAKQAATAAAAAVSNHQQQSLKPKPRLTPKIEGHLASYEREDERNANLMANSNNKSDKIDLPKIDISSRRELFEKEQQQQNATQRIKPISLIADAESPAPASIKERLSHLEKRHDEQENMKSVPPPPKPNRYSGEFSGVRDRFSSHATEQQQNGQFITIEPKAPKIDVPVVPLKERLMNLETAMVQAEMPVSQSQQNGKIEQSRTKKTINETNKLSINNDNNNTAESVTSTSSSPALESHGQTHLKDDEDSGINSDDLHSSLLSSLASQQSQPSVVAALSEQIKSSEKQPSEPTPAARKPEVAPRRQITPDLVKITASAAALEIEDDDDLLQTADDIDDEADNSVSATNANSSSSNVANTTKNFVNLTIKNVLVDSNANVKDSSAISSSSSPSTSSYLYSNSASPSCSASHSMVVENCSGPTTVKLHNEHDHTVDTSNTTVENTHQTLTPIDVVNQPVLTVTHKSNASDSVDIKPTTNTILPSAKSIYQKNSVITQSNSQSMAAVPLKSNNAQIHIDGGKSSGIDGNVDVSDDEQIRKKQQQESIQLKNERIKCQIVGVLEKNKIDSNPMGNQSLSTPHVPKSPKTPKSPILQSKSSPSKTKNIFDFIKRNLLNESTPSSPSASPLPSRSPAIANCSNLSNDHNQHQHHEPIDHSYKPLLHHSDRGSNHPLTSKVDIDRLLDIELDKLSDNNDETTTTAN